MAMGRAIPLEVGARMSERVYLDEKQLAQLRREIAEASDVIAACSLNAGSAEERVAFVKEVRSQVERWHK